jgi:hypothetical protein
MIDANDKSTIDLFLVKRRSGRPATGVAKSSKERQAAYRERMKKVGSSTDFGKSNVNVWIDLRAKFALERLARHSGITEAVMFEQLILQADEMVKKDMSWEERETYFAD